MAPKFGTSGLRGLAAELEGKVSALYATAFARYLLDRTLCASGAKIAIGRDFRDSSPAIAATVISAVKRAGLVPLDCGTVPTPALALFAMNNGIGAIMITGSHIPADRNGIKFYRPDGEIGKEDEAAISALASQLENDPAVVRLDQGSAEDFSKSVEQLFLTRNMSVLSPQALAGQRIGVYQHSTVARDLFVHILRHYGAEVIPLGRSETFIPVDTEAVSPDTLKKLATWSSEYGLDAIISADGDGDRPLVADEKGLPLRGDLLGLITARFLSAEVVVTPVTSNSGIEAAGSFGVVRTKVGSPFVIAAMEEAVADGQEAVLGFEANGGLMLASPFDLDGRSIAPLPTRDCFVPVLAVLALAARRKTTLSRIVGEFSLPVAVADRLENYPNEKSAALMAFLRASSTNLGDFLRPIGQMSSTTDIDGLRITLMTGDVIHFRPSGNAPEMRCYVEAANKEKADTLLAKGLEAASNWQPSKA
ncbi:phosphomannomutase [Ciceribacter sp. L1K22]|uniref:phosphomannomutase n=1 Tax=Ciceribacter sp. L1K22 TaxID=2820275 RepID=UPI001ABE739E|nr:phosphomannomutase [Ciceribacter sp. L1K22]